MKNIIRFVLASGLALMMSLPTMAAPPQTINYQGNLTNPGGTAVNSAVQMTFKLYNVASGGNPLWTETQTSVAVSNGNFNAVLGSQVPIPLPFDVPYWLTVTINADGEMSPRQPLATSPYAFRAASVDSMASISALQLTGTINTTQLADGSVTAAKLASNGCTNGQALLYNGIAWLCGTAAGPQGPIGLTGIAGPMGPSGPTGATGTQGPIGLTGATGTTGATGAAGPAGLAARGTWVAGTYAANDMVTESGSTYRCKIVSCTTEPVIDGVNWEVLAAKGAPGAIGPIGPQGITGATGLIGLTGATGPQGPIGLTGATGVNSLISMTAELGGFNCTYGGTKVSSGLDLNANGTLDPIEVTATRYICNGIPGGTSPTAPPGCGNVALIWPANAISVNFSDPSGGATPGISVGAFVSLSPTVVNPNLCNSVPVVTSFAWTLFQSPAGSKAALISATDTVAQLIPDVPGTYQFRVVATDSLGNKSPNQFQSFTTTTCGANPIAVSVVPAAGSDVASAINLNPGMSMSLNAIATTSDNTACPARFAQSFNFTWSVINMPPGGTDQLTSVTGSTTSFLAGAVPGYYQIQVIAHGSNGMSSSPANIFFKVNSIASCITGALSWPANAITVTSSDGAAFPPSVGAVVSLSPNLLDPYLCNSVQPTLRFVWALDVSPQTSKAALISTTDTIAQFTPDVPGTYQLRVVATDSLGNTSPAQFVTVVVSTCGSNPISANAQANGFVQSVGSNFANPINLNIGMSNAIYGDANTADNNPAVCPARFAQSFSFTWSIVNMPPGGTGQLASVTGSNSTFLAGGVTGYYQIQMVAHGNSGLSSAPAYLFFKVN